MSHDSFFVTASAWARKRFRCDYLDKDRCGKPIRRILVKEGEPQAGYCYPHYLDVVRDERRTTHDKENDRGT